MMRLICFARGGEKENFVEWKWGEEPPVVPRGFILHGLSAVGKEFEFVARMFPAWAPIGQTSGYWHGDLAKTILGCLQAAAEEEATIIAVSDRGG